MKKFPVLFLALAMVLSIAVFTAKAPAQAAAVTPVPSPTPLTDVQIPDGADEQIILLFSKFDSLKQSDGSVRWSYALTDLDHDNLIELLAASIQGAGRFTTVKAWEVNADKKDVSELKVPVAQGDSFPDIIIDAADTYRDADSGLWYYLFHDQIAVSTSEVYANKSAIALDKDTLKFFTYAYQHNEWIDGRMVTTFTDRAGNIITPEEYNAAGDNVFSRMERSSARFDWFAAADAVGAGRMADSYAVFLGLKQPPKPAVPAPVMTPQPDSPSSFLLITKNPTDEYHNEGDTAWFIANADNWSNATWTFVDPYGNECSWQSFRNRFFQCDVSGGDSPSISIYNTSPDMSGWGAYCTFYGSGQTARTTTAYLSIYASPKPVPTPVPTPGPIYGSMDGYVSNYLMSTVDITLDNGSTVQLIKDICTITGTLDYNCPATVYYYNYPSRENITACYIQGREDPDPPSGSMGGSFIGAVMGSSSFQLDNGAVVSVPFGVITSYGNVHNGSRCTVYYNGWYPSEDNIYSVVVYGDLDDGSSDDSDDPYAYGFGLGDDGDQGGWAGSNYYDPDVNLTGYGDDYWDSFFNLFG